jgi:multidrug efflux pump subunit AcrA (membrane-fusion protein)
VAQYPRRKFEGTITRHPEALAPDTRTMLVEVDLPNHDRTLFPGMYATAVFRIAETGGVPRIPDDALVFRNGNTYVPVVLNDRLHLAEVELGLDNGRSVEITQGLAPGAIVALNLGQGVREGERVRPVRARTNQLE